MIHFFSMLLRNGRVLQDVHITPPHEYSRGIARKAAISDTHIIPDSVVEVKVHMLADQVGCLLSFLQHKNTCTHTIKQQGIM